MGGMMLDDETYAENRAKDAVSALASLAKHWKDRASSECLHCRERGAVERQTRIVEWLRGATVGGQDAWQWLSVLADEIERGEHLDEQRGNRPSSTSFSTKLNTAEQVIRDSCAVAKEGT
jgi:hypothetical protein